MIKNYFAICLLLASLSPFLGAQESKPVTVTMGPSWSKGDGILLTRIKEKFVLQQGKAIPQTRAESTIKIEVLEKSAKSSTIAWTTIGTNVQMSGQSEINKVIKKLGELTPDVRVVFTTDERGRPSKIQNVVEVNKIYKDLATNLETWMKANSISPQMQQGILAQLGAFSNPETLGFVALRDPTLYFVRFDPLTLGKPIEEKFDVPMDQSGQRNLPAISKTNIAKIEGNMAYIEYQQVLDQKKVGPILLDMMQQQAIATGQPLPTLAQVPHFELQSQIAIILNQKTGFPENLSNVQKKISGPQGSVDRTFFFHKKDAPKASPTSKPTSKPTK
ncbi:MAG: hypothetical protein ACI97A_003050 [Planctomycetota bacterium]|jgi:hypothetical protein